MYMAYIYICMNNDVYIEYKFNHHLPIKTCNVQDICSQQGQP